VLFGKRTSFADKDLDGLLTACRAGNALAQRTLFKQYFGYAKSICLRYTGSVEEAEDVLNEGFLKVFQHIDSYNPTHPFKAWLRTILINTAISYHRKYHKLDTIPDLTQGQHVAATTENALDQLAAEEILALVQQLPPAQRTVFSLHVVDGYSLREIADMLEANEATTRSHFLRARMSLQQAIRAAHPQLFFDKQPAPASTRNHEN
jgi:RNA polymerase sigma-70 factor, ECF subfamily